MSTRTRTLQIDGPIHVVEFDGPSDGPVFVCVHGLGGHHATWLPFARRLSARGRVVVPDLPGFGFTPLAGRRATMTGMRRVVDRLLETTGATPAVLIGNSMGGAIALLQAWMRPESLRAMVLVSPAVPWPMNEPVDRTLALRFGIGLVPGVGETIHRRRISSLGRAHVAAEVLEFCAVDVSRVPAEVIETSLEIAAARDNLEGADRAFFQATRSLTWLLARRRRFRAMVDAIGVPTMVLAGRRDRIVPIGNQERMLASRPDWHRVVFDDAGHIPMCEHPADAADAVMAWLDGRARVATDDVTRTTEAPGTVPGSLEDRTP